MEVQEKNRICDCVITQTKPGHFVETCKCEFDADLTEKKNNKCTKKCNDHQAENMSSQQQNQNGCCPQQQQYMQPNMQLNAQPVQNCLGEGCTEDPYAALGNCVQQCMIEKGNLAATCGVKCPDCAASAPAPAPGDDLAAYKADKGEKDKGEKEGKKEKGGKGGKGDKGDKAAAKGGKGGDKAAADKGKKKKGGK